MRYGKVFVNTKERGLVYFTLDAEEGNKEDDGYEEKYTQIAPQSLTKEDLKDVTGLPAGFDVTAIFTDRRDNTLNIMSESAELGKISI